MNDLRLRRRAVAGGLGALGTLVGLMLLVVLPAFAALGDSILPQSGKGIVPTSYPTGGQSNDCVLFGSSAPYQFRIDNPQTRSYSTTAPNGRPVTFSLTIAASGPKKDKYFDFTITGAAASDVGVKGGSETARYAYSQSSVGPVTSDTALHATLDNQGKLYNLSNVTFCYGTGFSISGTVFNDVDFSGSNNTGDTPRSGRTVKLYNGSSVVATSSSGSNGVYTFANRDVGQYTVCLSSTAGEGETLPTTSPDTPGSVSCANPLTGNFYRGYGVTLSGDTSGLDFGTTAAMGLCTEPFGVPGYEIHLAEPCKVDQLFVVSYSDVDGNKLASVRPIRTDLPPIPMVEKITWSLADDGHQFTLVYDDTLPYGVASTGPGDLAPKDMLLCELDPRVTGSEFNLQAGFQTTATSSSVLPSGETSCLISSTTDVASGVYVAYVYSAIDGWRSTP